MNELKTLRVCTSDQLPLLQDRDPNFIYFLYDKLEIFNGKNIYNDPYAIVETLPEEPVFGIIYITLDDGKVKVLLEYSVIEVAQIENSEQLSILKKSGSTFFIKSRLRHLDVNRRIITLPFHNGTYELTVSLANDLIIDENTVIVFNPETNMFEISGEKIDHPIHTGGFYGKNTSTVDIDVDDNKISGEVKISQALDNAIKVTKDGLYVNPGNIVSIKQFESWATKYSDYKANMEKYLQDLEESIKGIEVVVSEEIITTKIINALESVIPEIQNNIGNFDNLAAKFSTIENRVKKYADDSFEKCYNELYKSVTEYDPWEDFNTDGDISTVDNSSENLS